MTLSLDEFVSLELDEIKEEIHDWKELNVYSGTGYKYVDYGVREQELFIKCKWIKRLNLIKQHANDEHVIGLVDDLVSRLEDEQKHLIEKYNKHYQYDDGNIKRKLVFDILELPKSTFDDNYSFSKAVDEYTDERDCWSYTSMLFSFIDSTCGTQYMEGKIVDELSDLYDACGRYDDEKLDQIYEIACQKYPIVKTVAYLRPFTTIVNVKWLFMHVFKDIKELVSDDKMPLVCELLIRRFPGCEQFIKIMLGIEECNAFYYEFVDKEELLDERHPMCEMFETMTDYDGCYVLSARMRSWLENRCAAVGSVALSHMLA